MIVKYHQFTFKLLRLNNQIISKINIQDDDKKELIEIKTDNLKIYK